MPKYKILKGTLKIDEGLWKEPGEEVELDKAEGDKLVKNGAVEAVEAAPAPAKPSGVGPHPNDPKTVTATPQPSFLDNNRK